MSYTYLQGQEGEYSAECFSDIPLSALSKSSHIAEKFCSSASATESCLGSQSGMTCEHLTGSHGAELQTLCVVGSRVKTSALPDAEQELTESEADCGANMQESFARYDQKSCGWKTLQCSLFADYTEFSETWPRWGTMQNGACWERITPAHLIAGTEFGLWVTPSARDWKDSPGMQRVRPDGKSRVDQLARQVYAVMWPTPAASSHGKSQGGHTGLAGGAGNRQKLYKLLGKEEGKKLGCQSLNPNWVEWLMGWPIGWTDLRPLAMDRFLLWWKKPGTSCAKEPPQNTMEDSETASNSRVTQGAKAHIAEAATS